MNETICPGCGTAFGETAPHFCTQCGRNLQVPSAVGGAQPSAAPSGPTQVAPYTPPIGLGQAVARPGQTAATATAAPAASAPMDTPIVVRRGTRSAFSPPPADASTTSPTVSRAWAAGRSGPAGVQQLSRQRKMAGDLPEWEPLPPGEILVRRTR